MWLKSFIHTLSSLCLQDAAQDMDFCVCRAAFCVSLSHCHGNYLTYFWQFSSVVKHSSLLSCHKHNTTLLQNTDFPVSKRLFLCCLYIVSQCSLYFQFPFIRINDLFLNLACSLSLKIKQHLFLLQEPKFLTLIMKKERSTKATTVAWVKILMLITVCEIRKYDV